SSRRRIERSIQSSSAFTRNASARQRRRSSRATCHFCRIRRKWSRSLRRQQQRQRSERLNRTRPLGLTFTSNGDSDERIHHRYGGRPAGRVLVDQRIHHPRVLGPLVAHERPPVRRLL